MAKRNERLGVFDLDQIPAAPAGVPNIEVRPSRAGGGDGDGDGWGRDRLVPL